MRPYQIIDKIKIFFAPAMPPTAESLKNLRAETTKLERQADNTEAEAKLQERAKKAKKRIQAVRKSSIRPLYLLAGLVLIVVIIVILVGSC